MKIVAERINTPEKFEEFLNNKEGGNFGTYSEMTFKRAMERYNKRVYALPYKPYNLYYRILNKRMTPEKMKWIYDKLYIGHITKTNDNEVIIEVDPTSRMFGYLTRVHEITIDFGMLLNGSDSSPHSVLSIDAAGIPCMSGEDILKMVPELAENQSAEEKIVFPPETEVEIAEH